MTPPCSVPLGLRCLAWTSSSKRARPSPTDFARMPSSSANGQRTESRLLEVRIDARVDQVGAAAGQRAAHGRGDLRDLLDPLAGHAERLRQPDVVDERLVE